MEKYGETLFALDRPEERRLGLLASVFDPLSTTTLAGLGVGKQARCLEIGAGSGSIAQWLSRQAVEGEVIATDLNTSLLEQLPEPNIVPLVHDVTKDPFPAGSFDVIHARFVLSHLPGRKKVLDRMVEWLRPGGFVMVESFSWFPVDSSPSPLYKEVLQKWSDLILDTIGTDSRWSREFPTALGQFGLRDLGAETITQHLQGGSPLADFWRLTVDMSRDQLIKGGYLTEQQIEGAYELMRDPHFWDLAPALTQTWGRR